MNRILGPLGRHSAAHPWRTLLLWVVGGVGRLRPRLRRGGPAQENWDAPPGTPAQRGVDLLRAHLPEAGNASAQVVVHDPAPARCPTPTSTALDERLPPMPHVLAVDPPRVSEDRATVLLTVRYDVPVTHRDLMGHAEPLEEAVAPTRAAGLQVALGGELPATAEGGGQGHRRADRHCRGPGDPAADVPLGGGRRSSGARRRGRARRGRRGDHRPVRRHGR